MEIAGLTVGVAGLVGTFAACVECFELVRIGKNLEVDHGTAMLKLDLTRLRFTRWGDAVGIQKDDEAKAEESIKSHLGNPDEEFPLVKDTIEHILQLFQRSQRTSDKMKAKYSKEELDATSHSTTKNETIARLRVKLRNIAVGRVKKSKVILAQASWAFYRKRDLDELIEDLTDLVTDLTTLAPPKRQDELCLREVAEMDQDDDIAMLDTVLSEPIGEQQTDLDSALRKIVGEIIDERRGAMDKFVWKRSHAAEGSHVHQGRRVDTGYTGSVSDRPAHYIVEGSTVGKNSTFSQGDHYGVRK